MWVKTFAVTYGMGVVTGVVMPFQFGTNWSRFADAGGNIIGPLLGYEVLTTFFLHIYDNRYNRSATGSGWVRLSFLF